MTMILIMVGTVMYKFRVPKSSMLKELCTRITKYFSCASKKKRKKKRNRSIFDVNFSHG